MAADILSDKELFSIIREAQATIDDLNGVAKSQDLFEGDDELPEMIENADDLIERLGRVAHELKGRME